MNNLVSGLRILILKIAHPREKTVKKLGLLILTKEEVLAMINLEKVKKLGRTQCSGVKMLCIAKRVLPL